MATLSADVTAAVASLQARWGAAAPRITDGALALAPGTGPGAAPRRRAATRAPPRPGRPRHPHRVRGARRDPGARRPSEIGQRRDPRRRLERPDDARPPARRRGPGARAPSWPGSTCRAASTRSRPSRAASASSGWSSSPRRPSTRAWPSVARCWPGARSTCSSSTCPVAGWPPRTSPPGSPTGSAGWRRSPVARRRCSSCSSRRASPGTWRPPSPSRPGVRLELARRSWIRLGRDIVGQRTEALVARNRYGPPGRRATLRILYADGGERDACLAPRRPPPRRGPRSSPRDRLNGPATMRLLHLYRPHLPLELARARASEPFPPGPLILGGRPWDPGPVVDASPDGPGAGRPAGDAARERPSARP